MVGEKRKSKKVKPSAGFHKLPHLTLASEPLLRQARTKPPLLLTSVVEPS